MVKVKSKFKGFGEKVQPPWFYLKNREHAVFKAKVVSGYRITIPDVERELLGIKEGDYVWVMLEKIKWKEEK